MINRVVLVGRLAKDPELRYSQNGVAITNFPLAIERSFANAQGERGADFPMVVTFKKTAEAVANHKIKGDMVGVEGKIQTRSWDDQNGNRKWVTEVIAERVQFLSNSKNNNQSNNNNSKDNFSNDFGDDIDVPF